MANNENLLKQLQTAFADQLHTAVIAHDEVTITVDKHNLLTVCKTLRDNKEFAFTQLIDLCGVDYLQYGVSEWATESTTNSGFSRAAERDEQQPTTWEQPRFAVVYHFLSLKHNHRLRLRVFVDEANMLIDSVNDIWNSANWFEREAFDFFGILFQGHPDLRRILTDYGFVGHPMRKDFPVSGHVEMRYDAKLGRVVYDPVDIEPRVNVPKVIRSDNRYFQPEAGAAKDG